MQVKQQSNIYNLKLLPSSRLDHIFEVGIDIVIVGLWSGGSRNMHFIHCILRLEMLHLFFHELILVTEEHKTDQSKTKSQSKGKSRV